LLQPSRSRRLNLTAEEYAYSKLAIYATLQFPQYRIGRHHALIARKLEAVERGEIDRLMISCPPRHGKSMIASEFFPAWYLGRNPSRYVISATYSQDLADDFGRKVRNQIGDDGFGKIFPGVGLRGDSSSVKRFHVNGGLEHETTQDGAYYAVGVGGPLTGRGAHLLVIDDPIKNRAEADSELKRRLVRDWYTSTAYTRLMPGGAVIVIQTRWNVGDLSGWLLDEHAQEGWDVLSLPAIDAAGGALWPEQYPIEALQRIKAALPTRDWSALYQQQPVPDTGEYFKAEWLIPVQALPPRGEMAVYIGADYAVTDGGGDYTAIAVIGIDPAGDPWMLDLWRKQSASDEWAEALCALIKRWRPLAVAEEQGQIKGAVGPFLTKMMRERGAHAHRELFPTRGGDKAARAQSIRGLMAVRGLRYQPHAAWADDFRSELLRFPAGVHDDAVDAMGLVGQLIDKMTTGQAAKRGIAPPRADYSAQQPASGVDILTL
jgi:predicted phage terminase large subunit-like protein